MSDDIACSLSPSQRWDDALERTRAEVLSLVPPDVLATSRFYELLDTLIVNARRVGAESALQEYIAAEAFNPQD